MTGYEAPERLDEIEQGKTSSKKILAELSGKKHVTAQAPAGKAPGDTTASSPAASAALIPDTVPLTDIFSRKVLAEAITRVRAARQQYEQRLAAGEIRRPRGMAAPDPGQAVAQAARQLEGGAGPTHARTAPADPRTW